MRWVVAIILAYLAAVLQSTVVRYISLGGVGPDLFVILAVVYLLRAKRDDALIVSWVIGLTKDLSSSGPMGLYAIAFGVMAVVVVRLRELVLAEQVSTQVIVTFAAVLMTEWMALLLAWVFGAAERFLWREFFWHFFFVAVYSAVLAPPVHWLARRGRSVLGFPSVRRRRLA